MPSNEEINNNLNSEYQEVNAPCECGDASWIVMPGVGTRCDACQKWWKPSTFVRENSNMSNAPTITVDQVKDEYGWRDSAIEVLPYNFFIVKSSPEDPTGYLMLFPGKNPLGRIAINGNNIVLESSIYRDPVEGVESEALDSGKCVDINKIYALFPNKNVEFKPKEEWKQMRAPRGSVRAFKCAVTGRLYTDVNALYPVEIMDPANPENVLETIYVSERELPN